MTNLFVEGAFRSHSGLVLHEKIECDALVDADWDCLARMIMRRLNFEIYARVVGVPRGGIKLAMTLNRLRNNTQQFEHRVLVVDDVLTTGRSLLEVMSDIGDHATGFVVFDRSGKPLPPRVKALFTLND